MKHIAFEDRVANSVAEAANRVALNAAKIPARLNPKTNEGQPFIEGFEKLSDAESIESGAEFVNEDVKDVFAGNLAERLRHVEDKAVDAPAEHAHKALTSHSSEVEFVRCHSNTSAGFEDLTAEEESDLARRAQSGDKDAFERLCDHYLRVAQAVGRKYSEGRVPPSDFEFAFTVTSG